LLQLQVGRADVTLWQIDVGRSGCHSKKQIDQGGLAEPVGTDDQREAVAKPKVETTLAVCARVQSP
jgi:hypothetical protein